MKYVNLLQNKKNKKTKRVKTGRSVVAIVIFLLIGVGILFQNQVRALFDPVVLIENMTISDLKETDGRTNVLLLGSDRRDSGEVESVLTDTIVVASIGRVEKDGVLISLPRDLWVEEHGSKINAIYTNKGAEELTKVVEEVMGIPIHYYIVVDFNLFTETVDALGGIDVTVDNTFTDRFYPVEGKENAPFSERYETVSFESGTQTMDGETALKFARSRKGDNNEGTDFARSARQQKVIIALKDKALSSSTLLSINKLRELYDLYNENVDTNISFTDVQNFYLLSQQIDFEDVKSIVIDDRSAADEGGLLYAPQDTSLYGNAYVLIPRTGDHTQIHAYINRYLFGN